MVLDCIGRDNNKNTTNISTPVGNTIPVCSIPRHPTTALHVNNEPVLINIKRETKPEFKKLCLCLLNLRSIRDDIKAGKIKHLITDDEHDLDGAFFTETWLRPDHTSTQQIGDITPSGDNFHHRARQGRKGGGVGALLKSGLKSKLLAHATFKSFEHLLVSVSNAHLHVITIYRPPPSQKTKLIPALFFTEFTTFLEQTPLSTGQLIILGDFNFHVEDKNNSHAAKFLDLLESFNLNQNVIGSTHQWGTPWI